MADLPIVARVIDKTKPGLKSAGDNVEKLEKRTSKFGKIAAGAALGVAAIGVAGIAVGVKLVGNFLTAADAIGKMATSTGVGVEELQELDFALQQGGSSIATFEKGIATFQKGLFDAAQKGTGPVADGLAALGLELEDIQALSPDEQFRTLAEAIAGVEDPAIASGLAQKFFGGAGKELLPTLKAGAEGLDTLTEEARRNGNIMSTDTVRGAEEVNDAINTAKQALIGAATDGFQALLPHVKTIVLWFKDKVVPVIKRDVIPQVKAFAKILKDTLAPIITDTIIPAVKRIAALFGNGGGGDGEGLKKAVGVVKNFIAIALPIIATVIETAVKVIVGAIELVITVLKSVITFLVAVFKGDWQAAWDAVKDIFQAFVNFFAGLFKAAFGLVVGFFEAFGVDFKKIFKGIVNGVIGFIEAIPNAFIKAINGIIRAWNGLSLRIPGFERKIFGETVGFAGFDISTPNIPTIPTISIPRLASGGIVTRPTLAEIGESGPEAVIPLSQLGRGGGGKGNTYVIQLDGERLGEFIINRVNQGSRNGELDLVGA